MGKRRAPLGRVDTRRYCDRTEANMRHVVGLLDIHASDMQPIHAPELAALCGLSQASVRDIVYRLRLRGMPIASGQHGYWIAGSPGELEATVANGKDRAFAILSWVRGLEWALNKMEADRARKQSPQLDLFPEP